MSDEVICRGSWELANCCGECAKCRATCRQAVHKIRQQAAQLAQYRKLVEELFCTRTTPHPCGMGVCTVGLSGDSIPLEGQA